MFVLAAVAAHAQVLTGMALFEQRLRHPSPAPAAGEPRTWIGIALSQRTPESILEAITTGPMAANAAGLN